MRATEVYQLLEKAAVDKPWSSFPGIGELRNLNNFRERIAIVRPIVGFNQLFAEIEGSIIFRTGKDSINVPHDEWHATVGPATRLINYLNGLHQYLKAIVSAEDKLSVFIMIPGSTDLLATTAMMGKFNAAFSQVVLNPKIGGKVELKGWEKGSFWFELYLGSLAAAQLIGAIAWSAAVVWKKIKEGQMFEAHVDTLKLSNQHKQEILNAQKVQLDLLIDAEARALYQQSYGGGDVDHEQIERLKHSIRELADLIGKGAEIHPALTAPEDVKNLFPNFKALDLIASKIPLLKNEAPPQEPQPKK